MKVVACAMSRLPMNELPELFPYIEAWVTGLQQQAIATGKSNPLYYPYTRAAGMIHPEKIRILSAEQFLTPLIRARAGRSLKLARRMRRLRIVKVDLTPAIPVAEEIIWEEIIKITKPTRIFACGGDLRHRFRGPGFPPVNYLCHPSWPMWAVERDGLAAARLITP